MGKNYLFRINEGEFEGEMFFVQAKSLMEAREIIEKYFTNPEYIEYQGRYTDYEAEWLGYDTY